MLIIIAWTKSNESALGEALGNWGVSRGSHLTIYRNDDDDADDNSKVRFLALLGSLILQLI